MNKVYIAEKPAVMRALADVLSVTSPQQGKDEYSRRGANWAVTCARGHIFELVEPDHYLAKLHPAAPKSTKGKLVWCWEHLPILFEPERVLDSEHRGRLKVIRELVNWADVVVHAGDSDREGQLLIDEILEEIHCRKPVRRVLVNATNAEGVRLALAAEQDNATFRGLRDAGWVRQVMDWRHGMTFSRALTLKAREDGYDDAVSNGRVMGAVIGLIAFRVNEVLSFKPVHYLEPVARIRVKAGEFAAKWKPAKGSAGLDPENRLIDPRVGQALMRKVTGQLGTIAQCKETQEQEKPPLPYALAPLQVRMEKLAGMTPKETLAAVQALYDAGLATYPRSAVPYLPMSQFGAAPKVAASIAAALNLPADMVQRLGYLSPSEAWKPDEEVRPHHGIVPTGESVDVDALPYAQRRVYEEIAKRYLAQLLPVRRYRKLVVEAEVAGERFGATGTVTTDPGWKALYGAEAEEMAADEKTGRLPAMTLGEGCRCEGIELRSRETEPPKPFTEATLIEAMTNVHKYVTEPKIKQMFEDMLARRKIDPEAPAGLGTPATQDTFLPKLMKLGLVIYRDEIGRAIGGKGKKAKAGALWLSDQGFALVKHVIPELIRPDMTAVWEMSLAAIERGEGSAEDLLVRQKVWIQQLLTKVRATPLPLPPTGRRQGGGRKSTPRRTSDRPPAQSVGKSCPECGKDLLIRTGKTGEFLGCQGYPACRHTEAVQ